MTWRPLFRRQSPVSSYEFNELATYNAERARGLVHTPEWEARMAAEQARFDAQRRAEYAERGWILIEPVAEEAGKQSRGAEESGSR